MTNEECIAILNFLNNRYQGKAIERSLDFDEVQDAISIAISALSKPTSEEVKDAIEAINNPFAKVSFHGDHDRIIISQDTAETAITALRQMNAEPCDWCRLTDGFMRLDAVNYYVTERDGYDYPITGFRHCPNCGRKIVG